MPCNQINLFSSELNTADADTLREVCENLGHSFHGRYIRTKCGGTIYLDGKTARYNEKLQPIVNDIKKGVAHAALKKAAVKNGFKIVATPKAGKFLITRV